MNNLQSIHISLDMDDFSIRTALDDVIHLFSAQAALKKLTLTSSVGLMYRTAYVPTAFVFARYSQTL